MVEEARAKKQKMTLDYDASMDKTKSFVSALQELKNLRPQLYSAAAYCEKSYLHSEQKQMLLDSLKDYAVRALVNTIDHLGTAAYKLNDILELQTVHMLSIDLKVTCVNQKLLTCQTYADKEGLRQQQLLAIIPRFWQQRGALQSGCTDRSYKTHTSKRACLPFRCFGCQNTFLASGIRSRINLEKVC